jgi:hypothetical protein
LRYEIEGVDGVQRFGVMQERDTIQWVGSGEARTVDRPLSVEAAAKSLGWLAVEGTLTVVSLFLLLLRSLVAGTENPFAPQKRTTNQSSAMKLNIMTPPTLEPLQSRIVARTMKIRNS